MAEFSINNPQLPYIGMWWSQSSKLEQLHKNMYSDMTKIMLYVRLPSVEYNQESW